MNELELRAYGFMYFRLSSIITQGGDRGFLSNNVIQLQILYKAVRETQKKRITTHGNKTQKVEYGFKAFYGGRDISMCS